MSWPRLLTIAFGLSLVVTARAEFTEGQVDLLVLAADDSMLQPILARLENSRVEVHAVWKFWLGKLDGKSAVVARTEGDPLNAVAVTTLAIRHHPPRLIVTFGSARPHDPSLRAGDVIISEKFAAFDGINSPSVPLGGGSDALQWTPLPHALMAANEVERYTVFFEADQTATAFAATLKSARGRVMLGVLGSANQENHEADRIALLHAQWSTSTEDTESAHIAGCAQLFHIPVIGIRVVDASPEESAEIASRFIASWK